MNDPQLAEGVLELHSKGYGFLRAISRNFAAQPGDAYVPAPLISRHSLREGLLLSGPLEPRGAAAAAHAWLAWRTSKDNRRINTFVATSTI